MFHIFVCKIGSKIGAKKKLQVFELEFYNKLFFLLRNGLPSGSGTHNSIAVII